MIIENDIIVDGKVIVKGKTATDILLGDGTTTPIDKKITIRRVLIPTSALPVDFTATDVKNWLNANESIGDSEILFWETTGDTTAPTITTATVEDANPDKLVVVFSEVVTITNTTGLTITGDVTPTLSVPTGSGTDTITFTLSAALTNGQSVTLNVASSNTIKDAANNALAATTEAITNNVAAVAAYDAKTIAYMNAVGTPNDSTASIYPNKTNADIWDLCEEVVQYINTNNGWAGVYSLHLMQGNTALKNSYNLKDIATFPMTFYGGWIHDAQGNKANGANTYGLFNFIPDNEFIIDNFSVVISSISTNDSTILGSGSYNNRLLMQADYQVKFIVRVGNATISTSVNAVGVLSAKKLNSQMIASKNGVELNVEPNTATSISSYELAYGANNYIGSPTAFLDGYIGSFANGTANAEPIISQALIMWEEGLGRLTI